MTQVQLDFYETLDLEVNQIISHIFYITNLKIKFGLGLALQVT